MMSDLPPGVAPHMILGNGADDSELVEVTRHRGGHPTERTECLVELAAVPGLRYIAVWVPEVEMWRFSYGKPIQEVKASEIAAWVDFRELFDA